MYRISQDGQGRVFDVTSVGEIPRVLRNAPPGAYQVGHFWDDSPPRIAALRRWGTAIKNANGTVAITIDRSPWQPEGRAELLPRRQSRRRFMS
jgi:hypothetical protein